MAPTFLPPPHLTKSLTGLASVREARRAVAVLLSAVDPADWHSDAVVAVSELVTNALTAAGACELSAWFSQEANCLRVEVTDTSTGDPVVQQIDSLRVGGHGLRIVETFSTRWGVIRHAGSKIVWFEMTADNRC